MTRLRSSTLCLLALSLAACVRPPTIVRDPGSIPGTVLGAVGLGQPRGAQAGPPVAAGASIEMLQADFRAKAGSDTVRFDRDAFLLDAEARQILSRQAVWLRMNPAFRASIEGHADVRQTRDHALALGERRAAAVHNFLLTQGVLPEQLSTVSWGRERPAVDGVHDAAWLQNSRVVTVLLRPEPVQPPFAQPLPGGSG